MKKTLRLNSITASISSQDDAEHDLEKQKKETVQIKFQLKTGQPQDFSDDSPSQYFMNNSNNIGNLLNIRLWLNATICLSDKNDLLEAR